MCVCVCVLFLFFIGHQSTETVAVGDDGGWISKAKKKNISVTNRLLNITA